MAIVTRRDEIKSIHKQYKWFYPFIGGLILLIIGFVLGASLFQGNDKGFGYVTNLYTEIISIGITLVILDRINEYRETQRLKRRLVREAGSKANNTAVSAIDWIRHENWLIDDNGLLIGADLSFANLEGALLNNANLSGANLFLVNLKTVSLIEANLERINLNNANLERANLWQASLKMATLSGANLVGVTLGDVDLGGAYLSDSNLTKAYLGGANLTGANLNNAKLDNIIWESELNGKLHTAIMPDGSIWTPKTDMTRFTDSEHPEFQITLGKINAIRGKMGLEPIGSS